MKKKLPGIVLGFTFLLATVAGSWAEPSPDLMNSLSAMRLEAAKDARPEPVLPQAKTGCAKCGNWTTTRTVTAGQSTVAVPDFTRQCND